MKETEQKYRQHELCKACGLCCDGGIFHSLKISKREVVPIFEDQVQRQDKEKELTIKIPCIAWKDGCCSIYKERPQICQKYQCQLLKSCIRGKQTWTKAQAIVIETRQHRKRAEDELLKIPGIDRTQYIHKRYRQFLGLVDMKQAKNKKKYAWLFLEYYAFKALIERYFRKRK